MRTPTRLALLAAALAIAACGGGREEEAPKTSPTTTPPTTAPSEAQQGDDAEPVSIFLDADVIEGKAPLTVRFDVDLDGGVPPFTWSWDYGDGKTGDAADPKHSYTYEQPGTFMVELEVADAGGDSDFDILEIEVFDE